MLLAVDASGLRHLRHAREVLGALEALRELPGWPPAVCDAIVEEEAALRRLVDALSTAVKAYRDFLERERTRHRGRARVAGLLGARPQLGHEALREQFARGLAEVAEPRRQSLCPPLLAAVSALRAGLADLDGRLRALLREAYPDDRGLPDLVRGALFPPLSADRGRVADHGDPHDDSAA